VTERRDPEVVVRNRETRAFAKAHSLRTEARDDGTLCIPCWSTRAGRGYWSKGGPGSWTYYHEHRRAPAADAARLRAVVPGLRVLAAGGGELYVACAEEVALRLMLATDPKFQTARRRRRLSPDDRAKAVRNLDLARRVLRARTPHSLHIGPAEVPLHHPDPRGGESEGFLRSQAAREPSGGRP